MDRMFYRILIVFILIFWANIIKAEDFRFQNCELLNLKSSFKNELSNKFYPSSKMFKLHQSTINWRGKNLKLKRIKQGLYTAFFNMQHLQAGSTSGDTSKLNLNIRPDGSGTIKIYLNSRREDAPVKFVCEANEQVQPEKQQATVVSTTVTQNSQKCYPNRKVLQTVQQYLSDLGLYTSTIDGLAGRGTKSAIRKAKKIVGTKASKGECITAKDIDEFQRLAEKKLTLDTCRTTVEDCSPALLCQLATTSDDTGVNWTTTLQWKAHRDEAKNRGLSCNVTVKKPFITEAEAKYILSQLIEFVQLNPSIFDLQFAVNFDKVRAISEGQWSSSLSANFGHFREYLSKFPQFESYLEEKRKIADEQTQNTITNLRTELENNLLKLTAWATINILNNKAANIAELSSSAGNKNNQTITGLEQLILDSQKLLTATGIENFAATSETEALLSNLFNPSSLYIFANVSGDAVNIYKGLDAKFSFEQNKGIFCASDKLDPFDHYLLRGMFLDKWKELQSLQQSKCSQTSDLFIAKGNELTSDTLYDVLMLSDTEQLFELTKQQRSLEFNRLLTLKDTVKKNVMEGTKVGFSAIKSKNESKKICAIVGDHQQAHQSVLEQYGSLLAVYDVNDTFLDLIVENENEAFKLMQRRYCGVIYGAPLPLSRIYLAGTSAGFDLDFLPIWIDKSEIQEVHQNMERERLADLQKQKKAEETLVNRVKLAEQARDKIACQNSSKECSALLLCQLATTSDDTGVNWTTALQWKAHREEAKNRGLSCNVTVKKPFITEAEAKYILSQLIEFVQLNPSIFDLQFAVNFDKVRAISEGQWSSSLSANFGHFREYLSKFPQFESYLEEKRKIADEQTQNTITNLRTELENNLLKLTAWATINILNNKAANIAELSSSAGNKNNQTITGLEQLILDSQKLLTATGIENFAATSETEALLSNLFNPSSLYIFANVSGDAVNIYKGLDAKFSFEQNKGIFCASDKLDPFDHYLLRGMFLDKWKELQSLQQSKCSQTSDLFIAKGNELTSDTLYDVLMLSDTEQLFELTKQQRSLEFNRLLTLKDTVKKNVMEGTKVGFSAIKSKNESKKICAIVGDHQQAHQSVLEQYGSLLAVYDVNDTFLDLIVENENEAFKLMQRRYCGVIYGAPLPLSRIYLAGTSAGFDLDFLPIWIDKSEIQEVHQNMERERLADLQKQKKAEETLVNRVKLAEQAEITNKQKSAIKQESLRQTNNLRFQVLKDTLQENVISAVNFAYNHSPTDKGYQDKYIDQPFVDKDTKLSDFDPIIFDIQKLADDKWKIMDHHFNRLDFGSADFQNRKLEGIIIEMVISIKNRLIGKYSEYCQRIQVMYDPNFNTWRDYEISPCGSDVESISWKQRLAFQSLWIVH